MGNTIFVTHTLKHSAKYENHRTTEGRQLKYGVQFSTPVAIYSNPQLCIVIIFYPIYDAINFETYLILLTSRFPTWPKISQDR